jgi:LysM repeat protein
MAAVTAEGTSTEEASEEGPWRFLKYAAAAGAVAAAVGAGANALKHRNQGTTDDFLQSLGPDTPPAVGARGLGDGGSLAYEVRSGDTLSSIASRLGTAPEVIKVSNQLSSDMIQPGQRLWVPKTHTIQKGDTLTKIAREHNTSVDAILKVNSVAKPDLIFPGDILLLP